MNPQNSPATKAPFRRRVIIIKRALQLKYVMLVFFSVLLTVTILSVDMYYIVGKLLIKEVGETNLIPLIKNATNLLGLHLALYLFIIVLISVFVSHKLAGPIFRLERVSESVAQGDLTVKVNFRQGDELFETAEYVNRMIESLHQKVQEDKNLCGRVSQKLTDVSAQLKNGSLSPRGASAILDELLLEVRHIGSGFKLQ